MKHAIVFQYGMAQRADQRFVWNGYLLKEFLTAPLKRFCLPMIHGCMYANASSIIILQHTLLINDFFAVVSINQVNVNNSTFMWALISRRSVHRAGARLSCRGIDKDVSVMIMLTIYGQNIYLAQYDNQNHGTFSGELCKFC